MQGLDVTQAADVINISDHDLCAIRSHRKAAGHECRCNYRRIEQPVAGGVSEGNRCACFGPTSISLDSVSVDIVVGSATDIEATTIGIEGDTGECIGDPDNLFLDRFARARVEDKNVLCRISWNHFARGIIENIMSTDQDQQSLSIRTKYAA